ncbi:MAG TPA: hypothetical protein EYQ69_00165 [Gemmatimonadetes bacterium]|nr:hypothetical protein [Gemmatimonadota bacterium]
MADFRAPTPSAGAEMAVKDGEMLKDLLAIVFESMFLAMSGRTSKYCKEMIAGRDKLMTFQDTFVNPQGEFLNRTADELESAMRAVMSTTRKELSSLESMMEVLSPLATLSRGYALPRNSEGKILKTVESIPAGIQFSLRVSDGTISCEALGQDS